MSLVPYVPLPTPVSTPAGSVASIAAMLNDPNVGIIASEAAKSLGSMVRKRSQKRKRARISRSQVGEAPGSGTGRRKNEYTLTGGLSDRVLYDKEIALPVRQDGSTHRLERRESNLIFLKGIKVCGEVESLVGKSNPSSPYADHDVYFNFAVVTQKNPPNSLGFDNNHFFRGNNGERGVDFDTTSSSIDLHCLPINTDKHVVLMHKRMVLGHNTSTTRNKYGRFMKYMKINRQIRFDDTANPSDRFWACYWCTPVHTDSPTPLVTDTVRVQFSTHVYFSDTLDLSQVKVIGKTK